MKKGFTLTEVIISLTIISVIAALTLPAVLKGYREKVYSSQLKKVVSQIETAVKSIMSDEHSDSFYTTTAGVMDLGEDTQGPRYFLKNYFKIIKMDCGSDAQDSCVAESYKNLAGDDASDFGSYICAQLVNGAVVCMLNDEETDFSSMAIDINGKDSPNITGVDVYMLEITEDGRVKSWGDEGECNVEDAESGNNIGKYAKGCLQKVINNNWQVKE